ncbi:hypothetical protein DRQ07_02875 [candidate division KSB1 bacterium]|nr:MAG: hypothetical protein DRQ07_02875 [candidate division KSB1 bacterium]
MAIPTVIVNYDGTNYGRVYLRDIGQRNQLGGGKGIYTIGQDQYLSYGQDATFIATSDVYMSANSGVIKSMEDKGAFTVTA